MIEYKLMIEGSFTYSMKEMANIHVLRKISTASVV
jgi:hypothetical protein